MPPFKGHRKQIISLSQGSTICIVWYSVISFDPRNILILSFLHTTRCNIWVNLYFSTHPCISEVCGKIPIHPNIACGGVQGRQNKGVIFSGNGILIFKKSGKIQKIVKISKKLKMKLIYIFCRFYCWRFNFQKKLFWILPNSKKVWGTPVPT